MVQFGVKVHIIEHLVMEKILAILSVRALREEPENTADAYGTTYQVNLTMTAGHLLALVVGGEKSGNFICYILCDSLIWLLFEEQILL